MKPTTQDRAWAEKLTQAVKDDDAAAVAQVVAAIHESAVRCAVIRMRNELAGPVEMLKTGTRGGA